MRMEEAFYNIFMYLYNTNILEYAQIARSRPKSMILLLKVILGRILFLLVIKTRDEIFMNNYFNCDPFNFQYVDGNCVKMLLYTNMAEQTSYHWSQSFAI